MDLNQFDSTFKSALDKLQMPFDPASWDLLESRLEAMPAPDAIDQRVRPTLERLEPNFDESSWMSLASKMDGLARARRVKWTKAAEATLILLLLLNVNSLFNALELNKQKPKPVKPTISEPIAAHSGGKRKPKSAISTLEVSAGTELSIAGQVLNFVQSVAQSITGDPVPESLAFYQPETMGQQEAGPALQNISLLQSGSVAFLTQDSRNIQDPVLRANSLTLPKVVSPKSARLYAGFSAGFDQNYLIQGEHKDQANGYNGALTVGLKKGKWGVETGIQYSSKSYQPERKNVEFLNDPHLGIAYYYNSQVDADVVSIPVKVTRRVFKAGKNSGHLVAGVSGHFAASKSYQYNSVHYPPVDPIPGGDPIPPPGSVPAPAAKGILENGGMTHNAYASADIGLRLERTLGNRYSAFIEPIYRHSLGGGLGPVASRLNTVSVQAGILATL